MVTAQGLLRAALVEKFISIPGDLHLDLKMPLMKSCVLYIYIFLESLSAFSQLLSGTSREGFA